MVAHFQVRPTLGLHAARVQFHEDAPGLRGVFHGVVAEIPQHLPQVALVHAYFEIVGYVLDGQFAFLQFECTRELSREVLQPGKDQEPLGSAGIPPGQLQHVVDDVAYAARVRLDDVGQALVVVR